MPTSRHYTVGWNDMKSTRWILGHPLVLSLDRLHRSLIRLLCTAHFRCAHSLARSLAHSLLSFWERGIWPWNERVDFISFQPTVRRPLGPLVTSTNGEWQWSWGSAANMILMYSRCSHCEQMVCFIFQLRCLSRIIMSTVTVSVLFVEIWFFAFLRW